MDAMRKEDARAIMNTFELLPGGISRRVLREICQGSIDTFEHLNAEQRERLAGIRDEYRNIAAHLDANVRPKNMPFYLLLKKRYPELDLQHVGGQVQLESYFRGLKPSMLSLLLGIVPPDQLASSARESRLRASGMDRRAVALCRETFQREGVVRPSEENLMRLWEWLAKGREGKRLTIISPVCPDYAAMKIDERRYRFTFDSLGGGIGLAAQRLFKSLPALRSLFMEIIGTDSIMHHVCVGDFEGFSAENVRRVGLDRAGFMQRLEESCAAIAAQSPAPVKASMFCALCGGEEGWQTEYARLRERIDAGEFEDQLCGGNLREIVRARKPLYQRWYPGHTGDAFFERLVLQQGIEYAVMGKIIGEHYENPLVLGADHHRMGYFFYPLAASIPVIYLSRNYE
jgi:hypothetical protein